MPDVVPGTEPAETVAPPSPIEQAIAAGDQAAFRDARRQARQAPPALTPPAAPVAAAPTETPEQEADSPKQDTELSEAGRTLRKNRADARKQQLQGEIGELVKQRNHLRDEVMRAAPQRAQTQTPAPPAASSPAPLSFETWAQSHPDQPYEAYIQAAIDHGVERRLAAERAAVQQQQVSKAFTERVSSFRKDHPDYDSVIDGVIVPDLVFQAIEESEHAPALAYHLGQHPEDVARLAGLTPAAMYKALGALEVRVSSPTTPTPAPRNVTSSAPTPPTTLGRKAADSGDEEMAAVASGDVARFRELRLRQRAAQLTR